MSSPSSGIKAELLAAIPSLRAFAMSLSGNIDRADDLVQETLVKAWSNLGSFTEGTNMSAWLFTILRNLFYSEYRKRRREVADPEGQIAGRLAPPPPRTLTWISSTFAKRSANSRLTSGKHSSWWVHPACPTRKPPRSAAAPSVP